MAALDEYMDQGEVGALNPSVWQTNPTMAFMAAMKGRGLFGALAMREQAALDQQRQQQVQGLKTAMPKNEILSPADLFRFRATVLGNAGLTAEAAQMADLAKKLDNELEFKDGVWYNKRTGA